MLNLLIVAVILLIISAPTLAQDTSWPTWVKREAPVYSGQFFVASDPAIIDEGDFYRMYYTCMDFLRKEPRAILCQATSSDGLEWTPMPVEGPLEGLMLRGREGDWDENLEGAYAIKIGDQHFLYYSAYRDKGGNPAKGFPAALALAVSADGVNFERYQSEPILAPTPGWYDNDAVYSEIVFEYDDQYVMIYVGHCYTQCDYGFGTTLLAATSADGIAWTKRSEPVLERMPEVAPWTNDGVAEPAIVIEPDGRVTLFFTGVRDEDRWLGMARGTSPFGPWEVNPQPILKPTPGSFDADGVLAPHVLIEDGIARMWYLGVEPVEGGQYYHVGYAEADWQ